MTAFAAPKPQSIDRETARETLEAKVRSYTQAIADPKHFATIDPQVILDDALWRLRWIDCAPEGARHQTALAMDKTSTPMGGVYNENVGPSEGMRAIGDRKYGGWINMKIAQHLRRAGFVPVDGGWTLDPDQEDRTVYTTADAIVVAGGQS